MSKRKTFEEFNKLVNKTHGQLYSELLDRESKFKDKGYKIISVWESDFRQQMKGHG